MIKSKKLQKFKNIKHGFFNNIGGVSSGIYKSLNCGIGSHDNKKNVIKNLKIVSNKIGSKKKIILLHQLHSNKIYFVNKIPKKKLFGDGIITNATRLTIGILTADCAPILFFEPKKNTEMLRTIQIILAKLTKNILIKSLKRKYFLMI